MSSPRPRPDSSFSPEENEIRLAVAAHERGLELVDVPGDGACFFHALALTTPWDAVQLRSASVDILKRLMERGYVSVRQQVLRDMHGGSEEDADAEYSHWVESFLDAHTPVEDAVILAASVAIRRPLAILSPGGTFTNISPAEWLAELDEPGLPEDAELLEIALNPPLDGDSGQGFTGHYLGLSRHPIDEPPPPRVTDPALIRAMIPQLQAEGDFKQSRLEDSLRRLEQLQQQHAHAASSGSAELSSLSTALADAQETVARYELARGTFGDHLQDYVEWASALEDAREDGDGEEWIEKEEDEEEEESDEDEENVDDDDRTQDDDEHELDGDATPAVIYDELLTRLVSSVMSFNSTVDSRLDNLVKRDRELGKRRNLKLDLAEPSDLQTSRWSGTADIFSVLGCRPTPSAVRRRIDSWAHGRGENLLGLETLTSRAPQHFQRLWNLQDYLSAASPSPDLIWQLDGDYPIPVHSPSNVRVVPWGINAMKGGGLDSTIVLILLALHAHNAGMGSAVTDVLSGVLAALAPLWVCTACYSRRYYQMKKKGKKDEA